MANRWLDDDNNKVTSKNRWLDDDDDVEEFDPNKDYFSQVFQKKEDNMLKSTERSLRMIEESERVGNATAVELDRQGEVLRRTEKKVDKMEQDLKQTDRHLRSIKSLWGAFVNRFSKEPEPAPIVEENKPTSKSTNPFDEPEEHSSSSNNGSSGSTWRDQASSSNNRVGSSSMSAVDDNLDLMGSGLARLKSLGLGLKEELDAQDPILDRLAGKVERVDAKMNSTNKEMIKIYHS